jgi:membrane peptidoglycan carboxypeptidase
MGSRDFNYEGYGQDNAATAYIQPGSSIKPLVYAQLFQQKKAGQQNYGSGSILVDEPIDAIYGSKLQNADRSYKGSVSIRTSLATSRNIPAVKAMYISGIDTTLEEIHAMGAASYCTVGDDQQAGLASAIGGCGIEQVDLVNAYASLARGGVYKPQTSVLEVKNSDGEMLKKWADVEGTKVVDSQAAYVVSDILSDTNASSALGNYAAKNIAGVKTATKTGTSDKGGNAKDLWMMSYSPAITMGVWLGNPDTTILKNGTSSLGSPIIAKVMEYAHKEVYAPEGKWKSGDWFTQPSGIQRVGIEAYPSWWSKTQGQSNAKLVFDKVSKKKATDCTPAGAKVELGVVKTTDPVTKKDAYSSVPDGYNANADDDAHKCGDVAPSISTVSAAPATEGGGWTITITITQGTFSLDDGAVTATAKGTALTLTKTSTGYKASYSGIETPTGSMSVTVTDTGYYTASGTF